MVQGSSFDYKCIVNKSKRIDKKIDLKTNNIKYLKKLPFGILYIALVVAIIVSIPILLEVYSNRLSLFSAIVIILSIVIIVFIYGLIVLSSRMNIFSYCKLKKIIKSGNYEVYKYVGDIQSKYTSTVSVRQLDTNIGETKTNGNILMIENQKIYLDQKTFEEIMFDKKITLYLAKKDDLCVLYNYERIDLRGKL